ncbi:MAG TPA: HU family DNA-binding protein [Bacteroidales bacterium]
MNKSDLVDAIAKEAGLTKAQAAKAINSYHETVKKAMKKGDSVSLVGFGTYTTAQRKARTGRNPQTGAALKIKAARVPKFRPGKGLKDSVK